MHEIERMIMQDTAMSICRHDRNRGQGAAIRAGVMAARADVVVVLDGDGQNDPKDVLRLYGQLSLPVNHRPRLHGISSHGVGNRLRVGITDLLGARWPQRKRL